MSARIEVRRALTCDWCGWTVYSPTAKTNKKLRKKAVEQDGWRRIGKQDVCGAFHVQEEGTG